MTASFWWQKLRTAAIISDSAKKFFWCLWRKGYYPQSKLMMKHSWEKLFPKPLINISKQKYKRCVSFVFFFCFFPMRKLYEFYNFTKLNLYLIFFVNYTIFHSYFAVNIVFGLLYCLFIAIKFSKIKILLLRKCAKFS